MICRLINAYREHDPEIALLPDAVECLSRLRGHVKLAAVSDGPLASQQAKAHRLGLYQTLDEVLLTASLGKGFEKPHPRYFCEFKVPFAAVARNVSTWRITPPKTFKRRNAWDGAPSACDGRAAFMPTPAVFHSQ